MTYLWTKISGPGTVTFTDATSLTTHVTFSASGTYVLRLTVTNPAGSTFDEITITVVSTCADDVADPTWSSPTVADPTISVCNPT